MNAGLYEKLGRKIEILNLSNSPDRNVILFLASLARKRYSVERDYISDECNFSASKNKKNTFKLYV